MKALYDNKFADFKAAVDTPGFDVDKPVPGSTRPLLREAVGRERPPFVKYLVEKGAAPNLKEGY